MEPPPLPQPASASGAQTNNATSQREGATEPFPFGEPINRRTPERCKRGPTAFRRHRIYLAVRGVCRIFTSLHRPRLGPFLAGSDLGSDTPRLIAPRQSRFNGAIGSHQEQESEMSDLITSMPAATCVAAPALGSIARDLPLGAHLVTPRLGYAHHGIYIGNNK